MSYFDGIKVGDRVYDMRWGWGTVVAITQEEDPLHISFDYTSRVDTRKFYMDGRWIDDELQTLFWSKPEFTPPPRPKRKVKKKVDGGWVNVYPNRISSAWEERKIADNVADSDRIACVHLTGEYEVEE